MQMFQPPDSASDEMLGQVEEASVEEKENGPRAPKPEDSPSVQQVRSAKKTAEIMINGIDMDMSIISILVGVVVGGNQHVVRHAYLCIPCL
ncbi:PROTEIN BASIC PENTACYSTEINE2-LIKE [Salix viminalis]|uniref:PROTEIN BASIC PENTACYSTEINE2-LIKE n=1 Tax=Salix viminalis TaxID=40686 RepID=A0A9Q0NMZ4_SALVM|nr:PROTEIN BASIC PENTACYSTEINE2-LIKE [Salix viminalis]